MIIALGLARLAEMRFPNGESIRVGDGPRRNGDGYSSFEIAYALGQREGDAESQATFGALINRGIEQGRYERPANRGYNVGSSPYFEPIKLLWYAQEISGGMGAPPVRTTDELPFAGVVLQRDFSPDRNPAHAFMAVVSGGHFTHGHASGMSLELYGAGEVLGANAGAGTYQTDEHENYRRLFAAYNCVIVNGASRSDGGWANLGINTVEKVTLEPAVGAAPVSPNHSFTVTSFSDDKGSGAKAKQERLVGIVRTSERTGYYVDVFRSQSALPDQFHDYLYHNIGEGVSFASARGELKLSDSPGRFVPVSDAVWQQNRSYLFPGWHFFQQPRTSAMFSEDVTVDFSAVKLEPAPVHMRLFITGSEGREYSSALAPATKEAPAPYARAQTPVLVIRQHGEAWTRPFAVIYEPFAGDKNSGSVQSVTRLGDEKSFAGFKVVSRINEHTLTQYVLVLPSATSVFEDASLGISFRGRYAVISLDGNNSCTGLYLGEGSQLRFGQVELSTVSGATTAASVDPTRPAPTLLANAPVTLTLPDGRRLSSPRTVEYPPSSPPKLGP